MNRQAAPVTGAEPEGLPAGPCCAWHDHGQKDKEAYISIGLNARGGALIHVLMNRPDVNHVLV
jgi:hypothetical protein